MPAPDSLLRSGSSPRRLVVVVTACVVVLAGCGTDEEGEPGVGSTAGLAADQASAPTPTATASVDPADAVTNGIDELSADAALDLAVQTLAAARTFRVAGSPTAGAPLDLVFVSGTPAAPPSPTPTADEEEPSTGPADVEQAWVGRGSLGTVSQDGSTFELRAVDGSIYVRGNLDWLAEVVDEDARRTLGEKWLLLPDTVAAELSAVTDPQAFVEAVLVAEGSVQSVGVSLINDEPALGVRSLDTESTIWISGTGRPFPLLVERLGATAADGLLRFSDVDAEVELTAPDPDDVVVVDEPDPTD